MILNHHLFYNIGLGCLFLLLQGIFLPKKVFKLIFTTMILKMYLFMALSFITCKRPPIPNIWVYSSSCFFFPLQLVLCCYAFFLILYESQTCFIQLDQYLPLKIHSFSIGLKLHFSENKSGTPYIGQDSRGFHPLSLFSPFCYCHTVSFTWILWYASISDHLCCCLFYFAIVSHFLLYMV